MEALVRPAGSLTPLRMMAGEGGNPRHGGLFLDGGLIFWRWETGSLELEPIQPMKHLVIFARIISFHSLYL
jgi:hypothetical protein